MDGKSAKYSKESAKLATLFNSLTSTSLKISHFGSLALSVSTSLLLLLFDQERNTVYASLCHSLDYIFDMVAYSEYHTAIYRN